MSMQWFPLPRSPLHAAPRGAAPIGMIAELPVLEQSAVLLLRQWCDGEAGRSAVVTDFACMLGDDRGTAAVNALAHLVTLMVSHGRRPFMRHDLRCSCFGGDESAFAHMVAAAAAGDHEDAMAFALTMLPAAIAYEAIQTAEPLGLHIHSVARQLQSARAASPRQQQPRH